ncbi:unnamed protein product [Calypogeia fissa]
MTLLACCFRQLGCHVPELELLSRLCQLLRKMVFQVIGTELKSAINDKTDVVTQLGCFLQVMKTAAAATMH